MSKRDLIDVITKILTHVPENDILKTKLNKMLENYLYTPLCLFYTFIKNLIHLDNLQNICITVRT